MMTFTSTGLIYFSCLVKIYSRGIVEVTQMVKRRVRVYEFTYEHVFVFIEIC